MINSVFVIIGTIIGAGFASGKEIFNFFNMYGFYGFCGLILSIFFIGLIIFKIFSIILKFNITTYEDFIHLLVPRFSFIDSVFCNVINIFLLISFVVMFAGFSAFFSQEFGISYIFGAILIGVLSFITLLKNINGIIKINLFAIPLLIFIILMLGIKNSNFIIYPNFNFIPFKFTCIINVFLYSSMNLIVLIPILITLKDKIKTYKYAKYVSFFVSLFLLIMAVIIFLVLQYYFNDIKNLELPIIYIASNNGLIFKYLYGTAILIAIFTTAISSGYGFLNNLKISNNKIYVFATFLICVIAVSLSNVGFSNLINLLYPILGYLGLLQVLLIFCFKK